jgi:trehalose-phosphatase
LKEIENLIGISGFLYAGNHGLEFEEQGLHFEPTEKELFENILPRVELKLKQQLENFKGVWVENKTLTLSVHYRELQDDRINEVKNVIMQTLQSEVSFQNLVLRAGKKVWEIRPPSSWNKGKLALWLLARIEALCQSPFLPIYIGDDQTDEDAFGVLVRERGVCVRVTQNPQEPTGANYYLSSPKEVFDFLSRFIQLKSVES